MTGRVVAITGGTGFVGRHLVTALAKDGWHLRLLVRRDPDLDLPGTPIMLVPGTLHEPEALRQLVEGADAVLHLGGAIKARSRAAFFSVNAEGSAALAEACRETAPQADVIMVSSLAAREPSLSYYAASKRAGEEAVQKALPNAVILRPSAIYGPGDRETLSVFKAARFPIQPLLNGPGARFCLMHVTDVIASIRACLAAPGLNGVFEMSDARAGGYSWADVVSAACRAVDRPSRPVTIPRPLVRAVGQLGDIASVVTGSAEMITSHKIREILHPDWSSRRDAQLPKSVWEPEIAIDTGFRDAVSWYRSQGWL